MSDRENGTRPRLGYDLGADTPDEASDFEDVAAHLGLAAEPVTPPPSLKADLFAQLASTPQLGAVPDAVPADIAPVAPAAPAPVETPAGTKARARWFSRPVVIVSAAAAAIVLFVGGVLLGSTIAGSTSFQAQQAAALATINAAPDVQHATADVDGGGTATLVWSGELGKSALVAKDLPVLPDDKTYELWYLRDGAATPAGTMNASDSGATWRVLTGTMSAGDAVGVTVEPRGGSEQPTTKPIVAIAS
ncbi:anti-sigma factor domain-containing protein [Leifsonia sp. NPDC058248]|uniref:anti-sigma factor n=1 Tax=Leifsonia sp. NPDC058248 TaxID=3346402 RepID=UPI0036DDB93B